LNHNYFAKILNDVPDYRRFLRVKEVLGLAEDFGRYSSVEERIIGKTAGNKPLKMYTVGSGEKTALIIGVPHSDEPLGSLVTTYFVDWMAKHLEVDFFGWRWLIIPVLEQRGMRMNEGWFSSWGSLVDTAKSYFREPTENQYEWTFPFEYKNHKWAQPRPESHAVKEILKDEKPSILCNLHHCGFYNTYFYFSRDLPEAYPRLRRLSDDLGLPLSASNPDVPFGKILMPGFYQMYGIKDYIDYYAKHEPENLLTMRRGASSDEWYLDTIGGFSFNCEVPLFESSIKKDDEISNRKLRCLLEKRSKKRAATIQYCINVLSKLEPFFRLSDPLLLGSVLKHVAAAKLESESADSKIQAAGDRNATNFEVFENDLMVDVADLLLLGQIWRVTETIHRNQKDSQTKNTAARIDRKIMSLANKINHRGGFMPIPLKKVIKMQLGSILIIADVLSKGTQFRR
jgi:hypothetical protein